MVKSLSVQMKMFKVAKLDVCKCTKLSNRPPSLFGLLRSSLWPCLLFWGFNNSSQIQNRFICLAFKGVWLQNLSSSIRSTVLFLSCIRNFKIHQVPAAGKQRMGKSGCMMVMESVKSRLKTLSIKCQLQTIDDGQLIKTDSNFLYLHSNFPDCRTKSSETGPCCLTGEVSWYAEH